MLFYHARHYHSASVGSRLVAVGCDECGCEYFYKMVRVGSGSASAPYGLGGAAAERSAAAQARGDLARRLEDEAETVPCPRCGWINDELVARFRRGRCRDWGRAAAWVGVLGSAPALAVGWGLSLGPAADRWVVPYVLFGGPAVSFGLAGFILAVRAWLRGRVRPGRDFPHPPTLPRGCPPALVVNPATGELEAAGPDRPHGDAGDDGWLDLQIGRQELPPVCCNCLGPTPAGAVSRHAVTPGLVFAVPLCPDCARHWGRRKWAVGLAALGPVIAAGSGVLLALGLEPSLFWIFFGSLCGVAPLAAAVVAYRTTTPVLLKAVDPPRGVVRLWFRNSDYLTAVARPDGAPV